MSLRATQRELAGMLALAAAAVGCSDDKTAPDDGFDSGGNAAGMDAGTDARSEADDEAGDNAHAMLGGGDAVLPMQAAACQPCQDVTMATFTLPACCTATNQCGVLSDPLRATGSPLSGCFERDKDSNAPLSASCGEFFDSVDMIDDGFYSQTSSLCGVWQEHDRPGRSDARDRARVPVRLRRS